MKSVSKMQAVGDERNPWLEIVERLTKEFMAWGCRFSRKQLPEIAVAYDCPSLYFWNWMDGEEEPSEKGFLRVLGYAWRKYREETAEPAPRAAASPARIPASERFAA